MSYIATGDSTFDSAANAAKIGLAVVRDPALLQTTQLLMQLVALENKGKGASTSSTSFSDTSKGIGLKHAIVPLKVAIKVRKEPWILPVGGLVVVGGLVGLGFLLGRTQRAPRANPARRRTP